jgi:hypothetical protein
MRRAVFVLLLLLSAILAGALGNDAKTEQQRGDSRAPVASASSDVDVTAGLSRSRLRVGKAVRFWLTIRNRTALGLTSVSLSDAGLPGFKIMSRCWRPVSGNSCVPPSLAEKNASAPVSGGLQNQDVIVLDLSAGQTLSVWGELGADDRQEKQKPYITVQWQSGDQGRSQVVVPLGELEAQDWFDSLKEGWTAVQGFLKDLALPILLAVLAYLFKQWEDNRETERRTAETNREEARQKAEWDRQADRLKADKDLESARQEAERDRELTRQNAEKLLDQKRQEQERERQQLLQTWNKMLPISHEDATKYYMPLGSAVRSTVEAFELCRKALDKTPPELPLESAESKHALYYFLVTLRRCRSIADERGGFYFKDRVGEKLTALCVEQLGSLYVRQIPAVQESISQVLSGIEPLEKLGTFIPKLDGSLSKAKATPPVEDARCLVYSQFFAWLSTTEFRLAIPLLKGLVAVLDFEMNKPYEYWYPEDQKERLKLEPKIEKTLQELAEARKLLDDEYKHLPAELEAYLLRSK